MKASHVRIYVDGKLVLHAQALDYDEDTGRKVKYLPPGAVFSGTVGQVMTLGEAGEVVKAADEKEHHLEIHCELF